MKHTLLIIFLSSALAVAGVLLAISPFSLSAIPEPGKTETRLAAVARRFYVLAGSRDPIPNAPVDSEASIEQGDKLYGTECADCQGLDGHTPTDAGRWMYPRAADLTSSDAQKYSDGELFWIIKNGIRLSGMPAFGNVETNEHIWDLVHYVRTLRDK